MLEIGIRDQRSDIEARTGTMSEKYLDHDVNSGHPENEQHIVSPKVYL